MQLCEITRTRGTREEGGHDYSCNKCEVIKRRVEQQEQEWRAADPQQCLFVFAFQISPIYDIQKNMRVEEFLMDAPKMGNLCGKERKWQQYSHLIFKYLLNPSPQAGHSHIRSHRIMKHENDLETSVLGIHFVATANHFAHGKLRVGLHCKEFPHCFELHCK